MKKIMNITTSSWDLTRYRDNPDLKDFYKGLGLDSLEVMEAGEDVQNIILPEDVSGVHLKYFTSWMDIWMQDESRLQAEYDDLETIEKVYGRNSPSALVEAFRENVDFAAKYLPEYLVFHVAECTLPESMLRKYHYKDEEVIDAAIDLVNQFTPHIKDQPLLLFENLWHSGLTMLSPEMTQRLLEGVDYPNTGVMLDVGHLLNTNTSLCTMDEGIDYVHAVLDQYDDLSFIKGVHLHQSLSGEYSEMLQETWRPAEKPYWDRFLDVLPHIYKIDTHQPLVHPRVKELVDRISPDYLVCELISSSREEHQEMIGKQMTVLA